MNIIKIVIIVLLAGMVYFLFCNNETPISTIELEVIPNTDDSYIATKELLKIDPDTIWTLQVYKEKLYALRSFETNTQVYVYDGCGWYVEEWLETSDGCRFLISSN